MARILLLLVLTGAAVSLAQDLPDAGLPDASVGQGGADQGSEENDPNGACRSDRDCLGATACVNGSCKPTPVKELGCSSAPVLFLLPLVVTLRDRRARRSK